MNDAPSDVKEFKTVNYEGKTGWVCDTIETDQDNLRLDPEARQLDNVITASLNITEAVSDGKLSGVQSQTIVVGEEYRWILRIDPTTSNFVFSDSSDVTVTFDGDVLTGVASGGSIYFLSNTYVAATDISFDVNIVGAAAQDISGAILTISLVDNIADDLVNVFIPTTGPFVSAFRAGQGSFAYVSNDENTDVEIGVELNSEVHELRPVAELTFSDSLTALLEGGYSESSDRGEVFFRQGITLPNITTNGTVTVGVQEGEDFVVPKPFVKLITPTISGDNFKVQMLVDDALVDFEDVDLGYFSSGTKASFGGMYVVPDFNDGAGYYLKDGSLTVTSAEELDTITLTALELSDGVIEDLVGAFSITGFTNTLLLASNANDTAQNVDIDFNIQATPSLIDNFEYSLTDQDGEDVDDNNLTIDSEVVTTASISNDDVRNAYYYVTTSGNLENDDTAEILIGSITPGSIDDKESGGVLTPGDTYAIHIGDAVAGNYRIKLNMQPDTNRYRGTNFTEITINLTIT